LKRILWVAPVICLFLAACGAEEALEVPPEIPQSSLEAEAEVPVEETPIVFEEGVTLAGHVGRLIENQDSEGLLDLADEMWPDYFDTEAMKAALADYRMVLGGGRIVAVTEGGRVPAAQDLFYYQLVSEEGSSLTLVLKATEEGRYYLADPVVFYSGFKNRLMHRYLEALKARDVEAIARAVYLDETGKTYPLDKAGNLLGRYEETFDLETLAWEFTGHFGPYGEFLIEITGSREGVPRVHEITVVTGDGQVGLRDPWAD